MNLSTQLDYQLTNAGWKVGWFTAGNRNLKRLSSFFVTISCFVAIMFGSSAFAQLSPASCGNINCTSNDVRIIRSYISGPNNSAINCNATNPFLNAELHLIVSSNTQRKGVSMSGSLVTGVDPNKTSYPIGTCYSVTLNNGSNNNLVYPLGATLSGATCETAFSLSNVFTSWGTGNTNFCSSTNPQCPATPAKCRYVPGETIVVDVKLAVDFGWQVGTCSSNNTRSVSFTSQLDLGADINANSITYAWDFNNDGITDETSSNPNHSFAPGSYPVTLTINASTTGGTPLTPKSITRTVVVEACCNLAAPIVSDATLCSSQGKKLSDLNPQASEGYFSWFDGADPATSFEVDPTTVIPVGTNTYWISYSKDGCESDRTQVTITVKENSALPTVSDVPYCKNQTATALTATGSGLLWYTDATGGTGSATAPKPSTATVGSVDYYVTQTENGKCESARVKITVTVSDNSALPTVSDVPYCKNQTATALTATGANLKWYAPDGTALSTAPTPATTTVGSVDYYVTQTEDGKCESPKAKITVTVSENSAPPTVSDVPYCKNQIATSLTATGTNLRWYAADGAALSTAPTPATTTVGSVDYYVTQTEDGKCESTKAKITVTVTDNSALPTVSDVPYCKNQTATPLTATGSNLKWYATDGTALLTAPTPSTATVGSADYYVTQTENGKCESARAKITVTVNALPSCSITRTDVSPNPASPSTISAGATAAFSASSGMNKYEWSINAGTTGATLSSNSVQNVTVKTTAIGQYTVTVKITNSNNCTSTCTYTLTVSPIGPSITYTQGFYGNNGGKTCDKLYSYQVMNAALTAAGGSIKFGNANDNRSFTLMQSDVNNNAKSNIYQMLPGGTTPNLLKPASGASTASFGVKTTWPAVPMSPSINNVLLAQTIALRFNIYYSSSTGVNKPIEGLALTGNVLTFVKPTTSCGSTYPTSGGTTQTIPCTVFNYLKGMDGGATIGNLLVLANKVLGGEVTTISPSDMNNAVDIINKGFDGGGQIIKVSTSCTTTASAITQSSSSAITEAVAINTKLTVSAFPNPYTDKVKFVIQSPVSGQATLDVFNMLGQKVRTVFQGQVTAGIGQSVEYNVPKVNAGNLIYTLRVGNSKVTGKLMH